MELIKELGRRIQKARKEKGLTQQELADLSHVSLKHVQGCERGVKNPSFEASRQRYAAALPFVPSGCQKSAVKLDPCVG